MDRRQDLAGAIKKWQESLTDLGRRNPALYFREIKVGTLRLPDFDSPEMEALLDAATPLDLTDISAADAQRKRIDSIKAKARENEEERGLQTLFVAAGMATWPAADGGSDPLAPMFFLPVTLTESAGKIKLRSSGELVLNRVLIQEWLQEHSLSLNGLEDEDGSTPITTLFEKLASQGAALHDFSATKTCYLGNFGFAKLAMVEDLARNAPLLQQNRVVAAITGDEKAQSDLRTSQSDKALDKLDSIDPDDELIVLEADEYQRLAVHSLTTLRSDGVVDGPPGTGKSQTIANLIATLIGQGSKVLFVAEKRAALDAVLNRLNAAGLGYLTLDLHGADVSRRAIYDQFRRSDTLARTSTDSQPKNSSTQLVAVRARLNAYYHAVNIVREECGLSVRALVEKLLFLPPGVRSQTTWYGDSCASLTAAAYSQALMDVATLAADVELFRRTEGSPWSRADFKSPEIAARAVEAASALRQDLKTWNDITASYTAQTTVPNRSPADAAQLAGLMASYETAARIFQPGILDADIEQLAGTLKPAAYGPLVHYLALLLPAYRSATRTILQLTRNRTAPTAAYSALKELQAIPEPYRSRALMERSTPNVCERATQLWPRVSNSITSLSSVSRENFEDLYGLADRLPTLIAAASVAYRVSDVRAAEARLVSSGFKDFVEELRTTASGSADWQGMLDDAWHRSHLERVNALDPALRSFGRETLEKDVTAFHDLDSGRLRISVDAVRRTTAGAYISAKNADVAQATAFSTQLVKKRGNAPLRSLLQRAAGVATSLCPCWMASPLSVSQLLTGAQLFDVIIFDEASQIVPEDAMTSIMRGKRAIVAGDQKQLPPSAFFDSSSDDDDDPDADGDAEAMGGMESLLDLMLAFTPRQYLNVHYRSLDERLIGFSNHEFYDDRLITFPASGILDTGLFHVEVDSAQNGEELSTSAEVARVVELILEHIEKRPHQSLGVIALGMKHARRIEVAVQRARDERTAAFFADDDITRRFFVKNLERVQGDERDAIILSLGYAKDSAGRLLNRLGPINHSGGERRLNVAVTRAKMRMTVVSAFSSKDMDPARFSSTGAQTLRRFLEYVETASSRPALQSVGSAGETIETDIFNALKGKGLNVARSVGASKYRVDVGVLHPVIPGRYVLAIESDGTAYAGAATARDRVRLRHEHLEGLGWTIHRIWTPDWHRDRAGEIARVLEAYKNALGKPPSPITAVKSTQPAAPAQALPPLTMRAPWPNVPKLPSINDYRDEQLFSVFDWIVSDRVLRSDDEIIAEAVPALQFSRRGRIINETLKAAVIRWRAKRAASTQTK